MLDFQQLLPLSRSFRRVYFVPEKRDHPARYTSISHAASSFVAIAKYPCDRIKAYDEKKQHPRPIPDRVQPWVVLAER
jgi:hypothetical protein